MRVLYLHACVLAYVNIVSDIPLESIRILGRQVHVESSVSLLLAVVDAGLLLLCLSSLKIEVDTVLVAI